MQYKLLTAFRATFEGAAYRHRDSTAGDRIALEFYEDLYDLSKSKKLRDRCDSHETVVNIQNRRRGIKARRGDGTFGEMIPGIQAVILPDYSVARGPVATVEIGAEVKILAKAMIKQIDRVIGDLVKQVEHFRRGAGNPICVGIVGVNSALRCTAYEGERANPTDGLKHKHPIQEAVEAEARLVQYAKPRFDELLILRYRAENVPPFLFEWADEEATRLDYGAILTRVSREYDRRF